MDYEKIIDALKTIKEVCKKSDCTDDNCPFCEEATCCIQKVAPEYWEIKDIEEIEQIKVFK